MSFKREGDDHDQLSVLRKRRVDELFAEDIPDNEAHLLSNGRIACTVCYHAPVFDTIYMLSMHRKGKKHKLYVERKEQEQRELQEIIEKRRHEQFIQNGTTDVQQGENKFNNRSFVSTAPYDPRAKRMKRKPNDRKQRLVVDDGMQGRAPDTMLSAHSEITTEAKPDLSMAVQPSSDLPRNSQHTVHPRQQPMHGSQPENDNTSTNGSGDRKYNYKQHKDPQTSNKSKSMKWNLPVESPKMHGKQLSKIFEPPRVDFPLEFRPYSKKSGSSSHIPIVSKIHPKETIVYNAVEEKTAETSCIITPSCVPLDSTQHQCENDEHYNATDSASFSTRINIESSNENDTSTQPSSIFASGPHLQDLKTDVISKTLYRYSGKTKNKPAKCHTKKRKQESNTLEIDKSQKDETSAEKLEREERKQKSEKYFQLLGAGWKKDFLGNWIQDENAEFDSDDSHPEV